MIQGSIQAGHPIITIAWRQHIQESLAIIDTGFSGALMVPEQKLTELDLQVTDVKQIRLGNGELFPMTSSLAYIVMDGIKEEVSALIRPQPNEEYPDSCVIGTELLLKYQYRLVTDYESGDVALFTPAEKQRLSW